MKVVLVNGSPKVKGCTFTALSEMKKKFEELGVEAEILHIGNKAIHGCIGCGVCWKTLKCVFADELYNEVVQKMSEADGIVIGSPVYYAGPNGSLTSLLDRVFYSKSRHFQNKPATAIASCRRSGITSTIDRLNKYFTINNMPVVSSQYWNGVHGNTPEEVLQDLEGLQTMRRLAVNMTWMLQNLKDRPDSVDKMEKRVMTNFIR